WEAIKGPHIAQFRGPLMASHWKSLAASPLPENHRQKTTATFADCLFLTLHCGKIAGKRQILYVSLRQNRNGIAPPSMTQPVVCRVKARRLR
ncbi:MAG: hypothetical protein AAFO97_16595, partial [Pseudomonadota bacterium]